MIAAVKVESSALDSMKEKLREVENLRNQISMFTKRLLDADQANLNLKSNLVKVQEMYAEAKKGKAEVGAYLFFCELSLQKYASCIVIRLRIVSVSYVSPLS